MIKPPQHKTVLEKKFSFFGSYIYLHCVLMRVKTDSMTGNIDFFHAKSPVAITLLL